MPATENVRQQRLQGELDGMLSGYLGRKRRERILPFIHGATRILDVGCGLFLWEGDLRSDQYYLGLDLEQELVDANIFRYKRDFLVFDFDSDDPAVLPHDFDLVVAAAVVEHFSNPIRAFSAMASLLGKDGLLAVTTPAPWADAILDVGARFGVFAKDKHQHNKLFDKRRLAAFAEPAGLEMVSYKPFLFFQNQFALYRRT